MIRQCGVLVLIWIYYQFITNKHIINLSADHKSNDVILKYNETQVNLGRTFFAHLIHDNQSFKDINEQTICSLMHFFLREASINNRHVQFSHGKSSSQIKSLK